VSAMAGGGRNSGTDHDLESRDTHHLNHCSATCPMGVPDYADYADYARLVGVPDYEVGVPDYAMSDGCPRLRPRLRADYARSS